MSAEKAKRMTKKLEERAECERRYEGQREHYNYLSAAGPSHTVEGGREKTREED